MTSALTSALIKGNLHNQMQPASPNKNMLLLSNKKLNINTKCRILLRYLGEHKEDNFVCMNLFNLLGLP